MTPSTSFLEEVLQSCLPYALYFHYQNNISILPNFPLSSSPHEFFYKFQLPDWFRNYSKSAQLSYLSSFNKFLYDL
ncbi:hypothetical protein AYI68_g2588 [Smittium mucronatum]|uniref:Uncharacterized protein n=1 Tax=Smittium mucronatum TaxID=133383 RepID=A0A1R0H297_9FUNG|nr:hypothetical protein AYI68_g3964 [Smittium mucronatum]OLY83272.1 hypothetical protein AYI68_g2588 [Smittium mucronatum]